ncbi:hypothetical protein QEN19_000912 [Hanseniaspora menglaensis]
MFSLVTYELAVQTVSSIVDTGFSVLWVGNSGSTDSYLEDDLCKVGSCIFVNDSSVVDVKSTGSISYVHGNTVSVEFYESTIKIAGVDVSGFKFSVTSKKAKIDHSVFGFRKMVGTAQSANIVDMLKKQDLIYSAFFSLTYKGPLYISSNEAIADGSLVFGGYDSSKLSGDMAVFKMNSNCEFPYLTSVALKSSSGFLFLAFVDVSLRTLLDSGTTNAISLPGMSSINAFIEMADGKWICADYEDYVIEMTFGNHTLAVTLNNLAGRVGTDYEYCHAFFSDSNIGAAVLGQFFMTNVVSYWDFDTNVVGIAPSSEYCSWVSEDSTTTTTFSSKNTSETATFISSTNTPISRLSLLSSSFKSSASFEIGAISVASNLTTGSGTIRAIWSTQIGPYYTNSSLFEIYSDSTSYLLTTLALDSSSFISSQVVSSVETTPAISSSTSSTFSSSIEIGIVSTSADKFDFAINKIENGHASFSFTLSDFNTGEIVVVASANLDSSTSSQLYAEYNNIETYLIGVSFISDLDSAVTSIEQAVSFDITTGSFKRDTAYLKIVLLLEAGNTGIASSVSSISIVSSIEVSQQVTTFSSSSSSTNNTSIPATINISSDVGTSRATRTLTIKVLTGSFTYNATATLSEELTTLITTTSCNSNACSLVSSTALVSVATKTVSGTITEFTTYCPLPADTTALSLITTESLSNSSSKLTTILLNGQATSATTSPSQSITSVILETVLFAGIQISTSTNGTVAILSSIYTGSAD